MSFTDTVDFEMRGANHPDPVMNAIERRVAEQAFQKVTTDPIFSELSFKTCYNFLYLNTFYGSSNPQIIQLLQRLQPYPQMVECEVVQWMCPLKCVQCEIQYDKTEKPMMMSFKDFKYVMDSFPHLVWAGNNALGEPWLNPDYPKMVKYLDDQQIPQEVYLTSFLLSEKDMEQFVKYRSFLFTKFSFDAATKETYEKIRVGSDFDKVVRNIKALDNYKREYGKYWPKIEFHYLVMTENVHECEQFIDFIDSLDIRCAGIMFSQLLHNFPGIEHLYMNISKELGERLVQRGQQRGIPIYFNGDAAQQKPPAYNCTQWLMCYIFPDGTVIPCCSPNEAGCRGWQRENSMGNIFETPMREIWAGEKYTKLRNSLIAGNPKDYMPVCKKLCAIHDVKVEKK